MGVHLFIGNCVNKGNIERTKKEIETKGNKEKGSIEESGIKEVERDTEKEEKK